MSKVVDLAKGKWKSILVELGFDAKTLDNKHHQCPCTGEGEDRFRFANRNGNGNYFCACNDGKGDGFRLLKCKFGWDFPAAALEVEKILDKAKDDEAPEATAKDARVALRHIQAAVRRCTVDPEWFVKYLASRGLAPVSALKPAVLSYGLRAIGVTTPQPAMVAKVLNVDGKPATFHITYLTPDGRKVDHARSRLMATPLVKLNGAAVRLAPMGESGVLGVGEGIETCLSAMLLENVPVWACLNAPLLEAFEPPTGCMHLHIFADNDDNFVGQAAAFALAKRMRMVKKLKVTVHMPKRVGDDWNDVWKKERGIK